MMSRILAWPGGHPLMVILAGLAVLAAALAWLVRRSPRFRRWLDRYQNVLLIGAVVALLVVTYFAPSTFITIPAGSRGIVWRRFAGGTDVDTEYLPGTQVIAPWNSMYIYTLRYQRTDLDIMALTKEALAVRIGVTIHHRALKSKIGELHEYVGPDYIRVVLIPEVQAAVRAVVSARTYTDVYQITENEISNAVTSQAAFPLQARVIELTNIQVTGVVLPPQVQQAVQEKLQQQQQIGEMSYRLEVEKLEANRKEIEARGIQNFQSIVSTGISEPFLKWKGIDATLALARSSNAKVVVIGTGGDGLPIILGGLEGTAGGAGAGTASAAPVATLDANVPETLAPPADSDSLAPMPAPDAALPGGEPPSRPPA